LTPVLLRLNHLEKKFAVKSGWLRPSKYVHAVNGVNLELRAGETIAIVGESGSGKSTTGRCLLRLVEPSGGSIQFEGREITTLGKKEMNGLRKDLQMVFQDSMAVMNPKMTIRDILSEPLIAHRIPKAEHDRRLKEIVGMVGLSDTHLTRYPHELSGGQRQRIGIARAIILRPKVVVLDEPVSALDVSVQSQVLNLLQDLQDELGLAYVFISHDMGVVEHIAHRVGVMYMGEMVEFSDTDRLFAKPLHPYTQALLSSIPRTDPDEARERIILQGELPSPSNPPSGCKFHTRCAYATDICKTVRPAIHEAEGRQVSCHLYAKEE